jgi:16S rRNA C967 or C1407 C5-methylase (RsmB/RsmF family)
MSKLPNSLHTSSNVLRKQNLNEHIYQAMLILEQVVQGHSLQKTIQNLQEKQYLSDYAKAISYAVIRRYYILNDLIDCLAATKINSHVRHLLCVAFVLLIEKKNIHQPFTIVNQTIQAAKMHVKTKYAAGLLNGVLRTYLRYIDQLTCSQPEHLSSNTHLDSNAELNDSDNLALSAKKTTSNSLNQTEADISPINSKSFQQFSAFWLSHANIFANQKMTPKQILNSLPQSWQLEFQRLPYKVNQLEYITTHPPLMLRVNANQTSREAFLQRLDQAGFVAKAYDFQGRIFDQPIADQSTISLTTVLSEKLLSPYAVQLMQLSSDYLKNDQTNQSNLTNAQKSMQVSSVRELPGFDDGDFAVQDAVAQIVPQLLDLKDGLMILDACSAPGGKILSCLEQYKLYVHCLEIDANRAEKITENLHRLKLTDQALDFNLHIQSVEDFVLNTASSIFDRIILDVPCSTSGVLRKHPEMIFARDHLPPQELSKQQLDMLRQVWRLLKEDGVLLYITCSIFAIEGIDVVKQFLKETPDAEYMPSLLHIDIAEQHDGFFYARFKKIKNGVNN